MSETLDPFDAPSDGRRWDEESYAFVEILFHSDLRRIGDYFVIGPAAVASGAPVRIGRDVPSFGPPSRTSVQPLADPCVSKNQLEVSWDTRAFTVTRGPEARREVAFWNASIDGIGHTAGTFPPDTLVAVGDRVLLRLAVGPLPARETHGLLGSSAATSELRRHIRTAARSNDHLLVVGETGVGKELVVNAVHAVSGRRDGPLLAINCAALPDNLVESELFGHARGAFSGASTAHAGVFRASEGGTLFLDEVGDLPLIHQAKLLRALQERAIRPIGDLREIAVDVRVIAATNRDLAADVDAGRFRADLYARLEPPLAVPPLRERRTDVPCLFVEHVRRRLVDQAPALALALFREASERTPPVGLELVLTLMRARWPRNVRELERYASSTVALSREAGRFVAAPPPSAVTESAPEENVPGSSESNGQRRPSRERLLADLDAHDFVQKQVAAALGVSRTTLDRWMRELDVRRPKDLTDAEVAAALAQCRGDYGAAARALGISVRGLKLRRG